MRSVRVRTVDVMLTPLNRSISVCAAALSTGSNLVALVPWVRSKVLSTFVPSADRS